IASRNPARPAFLAGRGRSRSKQEGTGRGEPVAESEGPPRGAGEDVGRPGRSRQRGTSRYTPPTFKSKAEEPSNSLVRERARAPGPESTPEPSRRRWRRPISRAVTEHTKGNELEDSPVIRITQATPKRIPSKSRSVTKQAEEEEEGEEDKVTNIKVFKKPAASRDVYARTRYTRKRNQEEAGKPTSTEAPTSTTTLKIEEEIPNDATTEEPQTSTNVPSEDEATTVETNTVESSIAPTESIVENEVVTVTESQSQAPTTIKAVDPDVVKIVFKNASEENASNSLPRRRKVLLRKRPVTSTTVSREDEEEQPLPRRRKVIRRLRVHQNVSTPAEPATTEDNDRIVLRFTTPKEADTTLEEDTEESTSTESLSPSTTETVGTIGYTFSYFDADFLNSDAATMASTLLDNFTVATNDGEALTEESTTSPTTFSTGSTDAGNGLDETTASDQPEAAPTVALTTTSLAPQSSRRLESYNKTYYQESRFIRKKFVRRRPVDSSENVGAARRVSSTTEASNPEASKRRKSLFIRRRPVSSTTARTTQTIEERPEEETDLALEVEDASLEATPRSNRANVRPVFEINLQSHGDSNEFWSRFTTPSQSTGHLSPFSIALEDEALSTGSEEVYRSTPSNNRKPESRPRYRVPESLRRTISTEGSYLVDSSPEESGESNDSKLGYQSYRQPRTRGKLYEEEPAPDATQSPSFDSSAHVRTRFYARRPNLGTTTTESPVTETLIPAKKFDYVADAHRRQQSLRTTPRSNAEDRGENLVDADYTTTPSLQPLVTRLVTSVEESATTERQKILIKTKYSSLTSTTRIPVQTTASTVPEASASTTGDPSDDESANEIRQGQVERSTLPIEGEFLHRAGGGRLTTESHESSTIEIESVFSNLIAGREQ
ncbi:uncharacterized protein LOC143258840, partial [Megalopta genalis]|uniref:uncharacterized protein LOC143258840 n=1 Tax=Megalopta genalis TaxID=115081 RepID=UPI003FD540D0